MRKEKQTKTEEELMEEGLRAIYGNQEKKDFETFERGKNRLTSLLLTAIITLAVLAVIGWGGYFAYQKYLAPQSDERFTIAIEAPQSLKSGEMTEILLHYNNPTDVPITALELDLQLPQTFVVEDLSPAPANQEDQIWSIGTLTPGSDGTIVIRGVWIAQNPSSTPIQVLANYKPANFNADFQDIETVYISTTESALEITLNGEEEIRPGELFEYILTVKNTGNRPIAQPQIELDLPTGFFLEASDPEIEPGIAPIWKLESIEAGAEEIIELSGTFAADVKGFQYFDARASILHNDRKLEQTSTEGFVDVLGTDLTVSIVANGGTETVFEQAGGNIRTTISFENTSEVAIDNASILLDLQAANALPIAWNSAELAGGRITSEAIVFDTALVSPIAPGERKTFNVILPLNSTIGEGQADAFTLVAIAKRDNLEIKSSPIEVKINTEGDLATTARYYNEDGGALGNGPMPPEVGSKTSYRIYWNIENSLHDLEQVEVTATLPPNVTWEDQTSTPIGTFRYDASTKTVRWTIDRIASNIPEVESYFTVSVTPSANDVGKFLKLTSESTLKAKDTKNQSNIESNIEGETTELPQDDFAEGKGIVIE